MNSKPDKIEEIKFPEEDQEYINCMLAGKPAPKIIKNWTDKGMDIEQKKKWYTSPQIKERMRIIQQKYQIGSCHICQAFPTHKLIWKLDGINLVEYYCEKHMDKFT